MMAKITCEFDSLDMANIHVPKLIERCPQVREVTVIPKSGRSRSGFGGEAAIAALPDTQGGLNSADIGNGVFYPFALITRGDENSRAANERERDNTVTAQVDCAAGGEAEVERYLVSLGARCIRHASGR